MTHFTERSTEQGKQAHFAQLPYMKSRHSIKHLGARSGTTAQPHGATRGSDAVGGSVGGASALQRTDTNLPVIKHTEIRRVLGYGGIRAPPPPRNKIQETRLKTKILSAKRRFVIIPEHSQEISRIMNRKLYKRHGILMPDWRKAQEIWSPRRRPPAASKLGISSRAWSVDASPFRSRLLSVARSPTVSGVAKI